MLVEPTQIASAAGGWGGWAGGEGGRGGGGGWGYFWHTGVFSFSFGGGTFFSLGGAVAAQEGPP